MGKCVKCGTTENLVKHHTSYIPEIIELVCRKCDSKEKRYPKNRGFTILKVHPQRGLIFTTQNFMIHFNTDLLEIETAPLTPVGVVFPYKTNINEVKHGINLILRSLDLK